MSSTSDGENTGTFADNTFMLFALVWAAIVAAVIAAWPLMTALSVLHGYWHRVPGMSFLQCFYLGLGLTFLVKLVRYA